MRVGFHVSIYGPIDQAVDRALKLGCNTFQIFTRNPRQWKLQNLLHEEVETFREKVMMNHLTPVFSHMPYLPNLASPKKQVYAKSIAALKAEVARCAQLRIPYVVTHLGSHLGTGKLRGFDRIIRAINTVFNDDSNANVVLLLENTAGTKNSMGSSFEDIQHILAEVVAKDRVGVCLDTSHAFAAGYDLRTYDAVEATLTEFDEIIGWERLKLIHLNDSKGPLNSRIDRHEHIGHGKIGEEGVRHILRSRLGQLPLILETPKDSRRNDVDNLQKVFELADRRGTNG